MWLFTTFGFFSIVQKEPGDVLTIRARARADLDRLREGPLPSLSRTIETRRADYRYRATAHRAEVAEALRRIADDIGYPNFKDAVRERLGNGREHLYHRVWAELLDVEDADRVSDA